MSREIVLSSLVFLLSFYQAAADWSSLRPAANGSQTPPLSLSIEVTRSSRIWLTCGGVSSANANASFGAGTVYWYKLFRNGIQRLYTADASSDKLTYNGSTIIVRRVEQLYFDDTHDIGRLVALPNGSLLIENVRQFLCGSWLCFRRCNRSGSEADARCEYPVEDTRSGASFSLASVVEIDMSIEARSFQVVYRQSLLCALGTSGVTCVSILVYALIAGLRQLRRKSRQNRASAATSQARRPESKGSGSSSESGKGNGSSNDDGGSDNTGTRTGCDAFNVFDLLLLADVHHDAHKLREKLALLRERFHSRFGSLRFPHSNNCWSANAAQRAERQLEDAASAPFDSASAEPTGEGALVETATAQEEEEVENLEVMMQLLSSAPLNIDEAGMNGRLMMMTDADDAARSVTGDLGASETKINLTSNEDEILAEAAHSGAWNLHRAWKSLMHKHGASVKVMRKKSGEYHFHPIEFLKRFEHYKAKGSGSSKRNANRKSELADPNLPSTSHD